MYLLPYFYTFITALCVVLVLVPFLRRWAIEKGTVDLPDQRKVHTTAMPRLGGIAIFLAFLFSAIIFAPLTSAFRGILAGGLVVFAIGIADDLDGLSSRQKFIGQIIACLVTIAVGDLWLRDLGDLFGFGRVVLPAWIGVPFTVFAVAGVCNAINLIDGLDGLAGGVSVMALMAFAVLGLTDGDRLTPFLALALAGAILGFLKYNFYPARIFMGDTGSLTVGFLLGFMAVQLTQREGGQVSPMLPVLILGLPLFDAVWVMVRRMLRHLSPFSPDQTHVHHKFLNLGLAHRLTVLVIYGISLFWACSALVLRDLPDYLLLLYLLVTALGFYLFLRHLLLNSERYPFLRRNAEGPIRSSVLFGRCADAIDRLLPLLAVLLVLYALLAAGTALMSGGLLWPMTLLLLVLGVILRTNLSDAGEFQLILVYVVACLAAFVVWSMEAGSLLGLSPKRLGDGLLLAAAVLVALKLMLRRFGEFFLSSADFLALALMTFLAIAAQRPELVGVSLAGPLVRAILLMLAVRTLAARGPVFRRHLVNGAVLLLAVFVLAGLRNL